MSTNNDDYLPPTSAESAADSKQNWVLRLALALTPVALIIVLLALAFLWIFCRVYVPEGNSLMLEYKGPLIFRVGVKYAEEGKLAKPGQIGVQEDLKGPGRYFYCPFWWKTQLVPDQIVLPGQVAICTSKMGDPLPQGEFLVEGDLGTTANKGVLRKAFGPGRYRVHPRAYKFEIQQASSQLIDAETKRAGWVEVPAGYVGVVTNLADNKETGAVKGIQDDVLPPGIYLINGDERQVNVVEIGFRELSINVDRQQAPGGGYAIDESGEHLPVPDTGINFPSNDGFKIHMDFTAIWGVTPEQAPQVVKTFGTVSAAEDKVIVPQSESICRNNGSKLGAVDLLIGDSRQKFQDDTSEEFGTILDEKGLTLLYGLVRHIYIPTEVRIPIQEGYIADELKLTREQERDTAKTEALLREAEQTVLLESDKIDEETKRLVASVEADGQKQADEIEAQTEKMVAAIDRQAAELDAQRTILLGQAEAAAEKLSQEATAAKFGLAVRAFGSPAAYTKWQFAEGLPEEIDLQLLYAGDGTLWTDLKNVTPILPAKQPASAPGQ